VLQELTCDLEVLEILGTSSYGFSLATNRFNLIKFSIGNMKNKKNQVVEMCLAVIQNREIVDESAYS
jgi:hypothetical protein